MTNGPDKRYTKNLGQKRAGRKSAIFEVVVDGANRAYFADWDSQRFQKALVEAGYDGIQHCYTESPDNGFETIYYNMKRIVGTVRIIKKVDQEDVEQVLNDLNKCVP